MTADPAAGLTVMGHETLMPGPDDTVEVACRCCGTHHSLRAFAEDPRRDADIPRALGRKIDRFSALALTVVDRLTRRVPVGTPDRVGVFVLNPSAGWSYGEPQLEALVTRGLASMQPYQATAWFPAAAQGELTIRQGFLGEAKSVAGFTGGVGQVWWAAQDAIEARSIDHALVVIADSRVSSFSMVASSGCGRSAVSPEPAEGAVAVLVQAATGRPMGRSLTTAWRAGPPSSEIDPLVRAERLGASLDAAPRSCPIELGGGYSLVPTSPGEVREAA